jgi:DNA-binding XRE family transcriptional regulator
MQAKGKAGISRGIYVAITGKRVVILRIFVKKTEKTPRSEILLALSGQRSCEMGKKIREMKDELLAEEEFRREYGALEEEFSIVAQLIEARTKANLTQEQVARRMGTTQSVVARLESGHPLPSLRTLRRYASAVGSKVEIRLVRE